MHCYPRIIFFFFFNDTATTEIYTLSLHDALPIFQIGRWLPNRLWLHWRGFHRWSGLQPKRIATHNGIIRTLASSKRSGPATDRKSTRLNSSHLVISYAVFCLKKKTNPACAVDTL